VSGKPGNVAANDDPSGQVPDLLPLTILEGRDKDVDLQIARNLWDEAGHDDGGAEAEGHGQPLAILEESARDFGLFQIARYLSDEGGRGTNGIGTQGTAIPVTIMEGNDRDVDFQRARYLWDDESGDGCGLRLRAKAGYLRNFSSTDNSGYLWNLASTENAGYLWSFSSVQQASVSTNRWVQQE
jgi:hypothetical protein